MSSEDLLLYYDHIFFVVGILPMLKKFIICGHFAYNKTVVW